jgi:hypothetical protein
MSDKEVGETCETITGHGELILDRRRRRRRRKKEEGVM